jgi:GNAT superfamily N-acetyltransferase
MIKNEINIELLIEKYEFISEDILGKFREVKSPWITEAYVYLVGNRIASFAVMMKEDLRCGFLHYHIGNEHREYFAENYPALDKKTNQILYIYTDANYRRNGIASRLLDFILNDLLRRNYSYVWLKKETHSRIYEKHGFQDFLKATCEILIDPGRFLREYGQKTGYNELSLIKRYNDIRLVKVLA